MRILTTSSFSIFVAKPRRYGISGLIEPAAFAALLAGALIPLALVAAITAAPSLSFALTAAAAIVVVAAASAGAATALVVTLA
jgi:hypothetical protein